MIYLVSKGSNALPFDLARRWWLAARDVVFAVAFVVSATVGMAISLLAFAAIIGLVAALQQKG